MMRTINWNITFYCALIIATGFDTAYAMESKEGSSTGIEMNADSRYKPLVADTSSGAMYDIDLHTQSNQWIWQCTNVEQLKQLCLRANTICSKSEHMQAFEKQLFICYQQRAKQQKIPLDDEIKTILKTKSLSVADALGSYTSKHNPSPKDGDEKFWQTFRLRQQDLKEQIDNNNRLSLFLCLESRTLDLSHLTLTSDEGLAAFLDAYDDAYATSQDNKINEDMLLNVDLSYNQLKIFFETKPDIFTPLKTLDLSHNQLTQFPSKHPFGLITKISLNNNCLTDEFWKQKLPECETLELRYNKFTVFPIFLEGKTKLLDVSHNSIHKIVESPWNVNSGTPKITNMNQRTYLSYDRLNISHNPIEQVYINKKSLYHSANPDICKLSELTVSRGTMHKFVDLFKAPFNIRYPFLHIDTLQVPIIALGIGSLLSIGYIVGYSAAAGARDRTLPITPQNITTWYDSFKELRPSVWVPIIMAASLCAGMPDYITEIRNRYQYLKKYYAKIIIQK